MATEKRLIDATPIIDECKECSATEWNKSVYTTWAEAEEDFMQRLLDAPTVDAVEVKHGRWVLAKPRVKGRNATYRCTACGKLRSSYYNDVFQWEYCPCGAKMDGDGNG